MADKQNVRHPECGCDDPNDTLGERTYDLCQALLVTLSMNGALLDLCHRQMQMASMMALVSITKQCETGVTRDEVRNDLIAAMDKILDEITKSSPWPDQTATIQ